MLGLIKWGNVRKARLEQTNLSGLSVLALVLPERIREKKRLIGKALRLLSGHRISRVLAPLDWEFWPLMLQNGMRPVDTRALRCVLIPAWVDFALKGKGVCPDSAVLRLRGERESADINHVARLLCPVVRNLVIDVPGGSDIAVSLQREFGLPVLPVHSAHADLTIAFSPVPDLAGAAFALKGGRRLPDGYDPLQILSVLWESGRIKTADIVLKMPLNSDFS